MNIKTTDINNTKIQKINNYKIYEFNNIKYIDIKTLMKNNISTDNIKYNTTNNDRIIFESYFEDKIKCITLNKAIEISLEFPIHSKLKSLFNSEQSKELMIFENDDFGKLTVIYKDDEPWFIGREVAAILGYKNTAEAIKDHCKYMKLLKNSKTLLLEIPSRGLQIINEKDVYRLIMRSKLESAEKFQDWVMDEVLPSIRKTGSYSIQKQPQTKLEWMELCVETEKKRLLAEKIIQEQKPKVDYADGIIASNQEIKIGDFAKAISNEKYKIGQNNCFKWLRNNKYLMHDNKPYQRYINCGWFKVQEGSHLRDNDETCIHFTTHITPKGQIAISKKLYESGEFNRK